ncbi:MAG TPA: hypothetical protein EYP29_04915 [Thermoplasmata archaeon]|nr:hypothetical protein [Thermoplasmata archaeon]
MREEKTNFSFGSPFQMENPISALFDLAEEVSAKTPDVKKKVKIAMIFIAFWLGVNLIFFISALASKQLLRGLILLVVFVFGLVTLKFALFSFEFFSEFSKRHNAIKTLREGDVFEPVPEGDSVLERFLNYLKRNFPFYSKMLHQGSSLKKDEKECNYFDIAVCSEKPSFFKRFFGEERQRILFIKVLSSPRAEELKKLVELAKRISEKYGLVPELVIIAQNTLESLPEELYSYLTEERHTVRIKGKGFHFPVQLVREIEGVYDFIPYLVRVK